MDKGIIKMVLIVMAVAITLLVGSLCLAMRYGGMMMKSAASSSDQSSQTNQTNGNGTSNSNSSTNQK